MKRPRHRRAARRVAVQTKAEWRALLALALECAELPADGELALMRLAHEVRGAITGLFQVECGHTAYRVANGFVEIAGAFASSSTSTATRAELAPVLRETARFLDNRLWDAGHAAFAAAHHNRPEIC